MDLAQCESGGLSSPSEPFAALALESGGSTSLWSWCGFHRTDNRGWLASAQSPKPRLLAILTRWCSLHSRQTEPASSAALVPSRRSSRRVAVNAASSVSDQSRSVVAGPTPGWSQPEVSNHRPKCPTRTYAVETLLPGLWRGAVSAHWLTRGSESLITWPPLVASMSDY
jgi:hypothetical protein